MADNQALGAGGSDFIAAADEVTYSGDTAKIQLARLVHVSGTEGSKTVSEIVFAEDAVHNTGDFGLQLLGVRNDAAASRAGTDGDYAPIALTAQGQVQTIRQADLQRISVQSAGLTIATTAYTAGDQVGNQFTLAGAARASGGGGTIVGVSLIDAANIIGAYDVFFFDTSVTPAADNAAFAISDSDALRFVGMVQLAGAFLIGNNRVVQAFNLAIPYVCNGGSSLYALLLCRFGHTFFGATGNLQLITYVERN